MILDLKKIKRSGKDSSSFFFEYSPESELVDLPNAQIVLPIRVSGTVTLTGDHSAIIDAEIGYTISGECTRCLNQTTKAYTVEISETATNDDEDGYPVNNDTVDLTKIVDDAVMINNPTNFLCMEDCKGICLGCGVNLNEGKCKCNN